MAHKRVSFDIAFLGSNGIGKLALINFDKHLPKNAPGLRILLNKRHPKPNLKMSKKMKNKLKIIWTLLEMVLIMIPIQFLMIGIRT